MCCQATRLCIRLSCDLSYKFASFVSGTNPGRLDLISNSYLSSALTFSFAMSEATMPEKFGTVWRTVVRPGDDNLSIRQADDKKLAELGERLSNASFSYLSSLQGIRANSSENSLYWKRLPSVFRSWASLLPCLRLLDSAL